MNIKTVEITKEDVSEDKWREMLRKLGKQDTFQHLHCISLVTFVDHDKVIRENFKLKAMLKDANHNFENFKLDMVAHTAMMEASFAE
jgi:hypothetical protein